MPIANYLGDAYIVMSIPGRIRMKIPRLYRSEEEKAEIEEEFSACKYVISVYANPLTASVLILFDPSVPLHEVFTEFGMPLSILETGDLNNYANSVSTEQTQPIQSEPRLKQQETSEAEHAVSTDQQIYPPWHLHHQDAALEFLHSSAKHGLSTKVVEERLRSGLNLLPQQKPASSFEILLNQFKSLPVLLLGVSAALSLVTGGLSEAAAIVAVLALNGGIGFTTERRAESAIASLSELIDDVVPVVRDSKVKEVEASHIVPGDVLVLAPGIRIAADARLLNSNGLTVDESTLTGESMPVTKIPSALPQPVPLADRFNMVYRGTAASMGTGLALVVGTGRHTEIGAIQSLMAETEHPRTPIQKQLDELGTRLVKISVATCAGVFAIGLLRGYGWMQMLKASISLAIAAVPEGLPTVATTSLARGIHLMREKNALIRRLHAVETIGAIQTICLDKTGTLTMNRMSAVAVQTSHHHYEIDQDRFSQQMGTMLDPSTTDVFRLLQVCVLCNQTELNEEEQGFSGNGSSTERALIDLAVQAGLPAAEMRSQYPLFMTELRAEGRNYMTTVHGTPDSPSHLIAVKGNPTEVINLCRYCQAGDQVTELDEKLKNDITEQNRDMAEKQLRVLGFAYAEVPPEAINKINQENLVWLGLVGLADPLRIGMKSLIESFHKAGIRTVMLTGDQAATAYSIGKSLHITNGNELHIVNSERLDEIEPDVLKALTEHADIFSRISPAHKLKIVQALQANGKTIAMTGDGINDGPALQAADIGIAMGHSGTDLARSAADIVLTDDRLETLLEAVRQGRTISSNIKKSLHFLLSSNLSEILVVLGATSLGAGHPLTPMQLLWLNLLTDVLPAIALTAEPVETDVMEQMPRDPSKPLISKADLMHYAREGSYIAGGSLAAYLYGITRYGSGAQASTIAFNSLILGQMLHALSCRSDSHGVFSDGALKPNRQLSMAIGGSIGLQLLANLIPGLRQLLGIGTTNGLNVLVTLAGAGIPLFLNEAAKQKTSASHVQHAPVGDQPVGMTSPN